MDKSRRVRDSPVPRLCYKDRSEPQPGQGYLPDLRSYSACRSMRLVLYAGRSSASAIRRCVHGPAMTGRMLPSDGSHATRIWIVRRSSVVEQLTVNQLVAGSNPAAGASFPAYRNARLPVMRGPTSTDAGSRLTAQFSTQIVTGPSLTRAISISAPKTPVVTSRPCSRSWLMKCS